MILINCIRCIFYFTCFFKKSEVLYMLMEIAWNQQLCVHYIQFLLPNILGCLQNKQNVSFFSYCRCYKKNIGNIYSCCLGKYSDLTIPFIIQSPVWSSGEGREEVWGGRQGSLSILRLPKAYAHL